MILKGLYGTYEVPNCCDKMIEEYEEDNMVSLLDNIPFKPAKADKPIVYISSDGGNGGMLEINYCPFCGTKIDIREVSPDEYTTV